jgi:hypothetical protein
MKRILTLVLAVALCLPVPVGAEFITQQKMYNPAPMLQANYMSNPNNLGVDLKRGLVAYYRMNEPVWNGSIAEVRDISGQSGEPTENQILNSEDLTAAGWNGAVTVVNATSVEDTSGAATQSLFSDSVGDPGNSPWTGSLYVPVESSTPAIYPAMAVIFLGGTAKQAGVIIDTENGTIVDRVTGGAWVSPENSTITGPMVVDGINHWRVSITLTPNDNNTSGALYFYPAANNNAGSSFQSARTGASSVRRLQLSNSSSLLGYIATSGATVSSTFNHGTIVNGTTNIAGGKLDRGGRFDPALFQYISTANPSQLVGDLDTFSISMWVKTSAASGQLPLITWPVGLNTIPQFTLDENNTRIFLQMETTNVRVWTQDTAIADGAWHHIVVTLPGAAQTDITSAQCYIDGVLQTVFSTTSSGAQRAKSTFMIGYAGTNFYDDDMDEVAIWNRVISANEVLELYNGGRGRYIN